MQGMVDDDIFDIVLEDEDWSDSSNECQNTQ
jgi:hypothetical protein